jgi:glutathione synthase
MIRAMQPVQLEDVVGELGVFGALLGTKDTVLHNTAGGHILRTKGALVDEGGVAVGAAVIDSPFLIG